MELLYVYPAGARLPKAARKKKREQHKEDFGNIQVHFKTERELEKREIEHRRASRVEPNGFPVGKPCKKRNSVRRLGDHSADDETRDQKKYDQQRAFPRGFSHFFHSLPTDGSEPPRGTEAAGPARGLIEAFRLHGGQRRNGHHDELRDPLAGRHGICLLR